MKKCLGIILALGMVFSTQASAFAEETQPVSQVTVSLSTIENIMTQYSTTIKTVENNLKIAKENYDDSDTDYYENQYDIAKARYEQNVQSEILSAKQQYINYCVDSVQLTANQASADDDTHKLQICAAKLSKGYISQKDYDDQSQQAAKSKSNLEAQRRKVIREKQDLKTLLNVPSGIDLNIQPLTLEDMQIGDLSSIDYSRDQILMLNKSTEIIAAGLQYDYSNDQALSTASEENAKFTYDQTKNGQKAAFKQLYNTLMASWDTYQQDNAEMQRKASDLALEQKKLSLGYSSQRAVEDANLQYLLSKTTVTLDKSNLYTNYLNYENMKNGYSTAGSSIK